MAEQGVGKDRVVQAGHVDGHQRSRAAAQRMGGADKTLLAHPGFSGHEQGARTFGYGLQVGKNGVHGRTAGTDAGKDLGMAQFARDQPIGHFPVFLAQFQQVHRPLDAAKDALLVIGLDVVVVGSEFHAVHGRGQLVETA
jgi:hypothetical protein